MSEPQDLTPKEMAQEIRLAHARLEECQEHSSHGSLRDRISWKIQQMVEQHARTQSALEATAHEKDAMRSERLSAQCREQESSYRASTVCRERWEQISRLTAAIAAKDVELAALKGRECVWTEAVGCYDTS